MRTLAGLMLMCALTSADEPTVLVVEMKITTDGGATLLTAPRVCITPNGKGMVQFGNIDRDIRMEVQGNGLKDAAKHLVVAKITEPGAGGRPVVVPFPKLEIGEGQPAITSAKSGEKTYVMTVNITRK